MSKFPVTESVQSKTTSQLVIPVALFAMGLTALSAAASVGIQALREQSLPAANYQSPASYVRREVLVKFKADAKNPESTLRRVAGRRQTAYRLATGGDVVSRHDPNVKSNRDLYRSVRITPGFRAAKKLMDIVNRSTLPESVTNRGRDLGLDRWYLLTTHSHDTDIPELVRQLAGEGDVEAAHANTLYTPSAVVRTDAEVLPTTATVNSSVPDDPSYDAYGRIDAQTPDQWGLHKIRAAAAWSMTTGSPDVTIAVIDSGVDYLHPELEPQIWMNRGQPDATEDLNGNGCADYWPSNVSQHTDTIPVRCRGGETGYIEGDINGNGQTGDEDGNGFIDDLNGMDFRDNAAQRWNDIDGPMDQSPESHGTAVAGIIGAATNNGRQLAGVCWRCTIMPVRIGAAEEYNIAAFAQTIRYAVDAGADILNISISGGDFQLLREAVTYAVGNGRVVVASSGNSNSDLALYPASYPGVISVGATTPNDQRWVSTSTSEDRPGSSYGATVDVMAPGASILSLVRDDHNVLAMLDGTSLAAPHVSGVVGLMLSVNPSLTPDVIEEVLATTATPMPNSSMPSNATNAPCGGHTLYTACGQINAFAAVSRAKALRVDLVPTGKGIRNSDGTVKTDVRLNNTGGFAVEGVEYRLIDPAAPRVQDGGSVLLERTVDLNAAGTYQASESLGSQSGITSLTLAVDPAHRIAEAADLLDAEANNEVTLPIVPNTAPSIGTIDARTVAEGARLTFTVPASDAENLLVSYSLTAITTPPGQPAPDGLLNPDTGVFDWVPRYDQQGTYVFRIRVSDGDLAAERDVTVTVTDVTPPGFIGVLGQGFGRDILDAKYVKENDPVVLATIQPDRTALVGLEYELGPRNIPISDLEYVRFIFDGRGKWDALPERVRVPVDDAASVMRIGTKYYFDIRPEPGWSAADGIVYACRTYATGPCSVAHPYATTLRFIEQDDAGVNMPAPDGWRPGYGWDMPWERWATEALREARHSDRDKNGVGFRIWSTGTSPSDKLTHMAVAILDDSGGSISPTYEIELHLKSLNQAPTVTVPQASYVLPKRNVPISFDVQLRDANKDYLTLKKTLPSGARLDLVGTAGMGESTYRFSWTPNYSQSGVHTVEIWGNDGMADGPKQRVEITVNNQAPTLQAIPDQTVQVGSTLTMTLPASDPDGDPLTYFDMSGLPGFSINNGRPIYRPTSAAIGEHQVRIRVSDGAAFAERTFTIRVSGEPPDPVDRQPGGSGDKETISRNGILRRP